MRYSKLFGKTEKQPKSDMKATSHKLLYQAGFVRESTAGRYFFLPLGQIVQNKITNIIRQEMNKAGSQEMLTPVLHPLELWKETNRTNEAGFELMKIKDRRGADFALGGTAEEMFVDVVRKLKLSYKDLPINLYQFSLKFRDEMRARGGLLRVREFIMKDAYSFDLNEEEFKKEYKKMWNTYTQIYTRLGLKSNAVLADNGYIGGEYSHEFIVDAKVGESKYFISEDGKYIAHEDVAKFKRNEVNADQELKVMEIIKQPEWVQTMEDNIKHYGVSKEHFLKNVVYKNRVTKEIIIAVIRGDLDVNKTKLEKVLRATGQLEEATTEDLTTLGTKTGFVHSWGHKGAKYVGDLSLQSVKNFIGGQKENETDTINVNYGRDFECDILADIALAKEGFETVDGNGKLIEHTGIEVGNIFQLGYHYSSKMQEAVYTDKDGSQKMFYMGCYGIGIGRTLAAIVETNSDEKGIIWPESVAPFKYHLIGLDLQDENIKIAVESIYNKLLDLGIEVLYDDREDATAGQKFADADLIGCPYRIIVSKKTIEKGNKIELKKRTEKENSLVDIEAILKV